MVNCENIVKYMRIYEKNGKIYEKICQNDDKLNENMNILFKKDDKW